MQINEDILEKHLDNIRALQVPSGLFLASRSDVSTGYNKAWLRDNFYTCLAFEEIEDWVTVKKVWKALLQVFIKHKNKISRQMKAIRVELRVSLQKGGSWENARKSNKSLWTNRNRYYHLR